MHLDFSNRGIRVFDAAALDLGPEGTRLIHSVDLSGNHLEALFNMGAVFKGIKTLNLSGNNLRDFFEVNEELDSVERRRYLLPTTLERLDLSDNHLTSVRALTGTLPNLHHLILSANPAFDVDFPPTPPQDSSTSTSEWSGRGGKPLYTQPQSTGRGPRVDAGPFPRLSHIELCGCSLASTAPLSTLRALVKVSLRSNPLATVEDVVDGLVDLPYLRHVLLEGTPVCSAHWAKLLRALTRGVRKLTSINGLPVSQSVNAPAPSPVYDFAKSKLASNSTGSIHMRHSALSGNARSRVEKPSNHLLLTRVAELERILKEVSDEEAELRKLTKQQERSLERLRSVECEQQVAVETLKSNKTELEAAIAITDKSIQKCESDFARIHDGVLLKRVEGA